MKKPYLVVIAFILLFSWNDALLAQPQPATTKAQEKPVLLPPAAFKQQLASKPGVLIDVRTASEYKKGAIAGAVLMDIFNDSFDTELAKLNRNQIYYVYCGVGGRSAEAVEKMEKLGFKHVYELLGGYSAWKQAGF